VGFQREREAFPPTAGNAQRVTQLSRLERPVPDRLGKPVNEDPKRARGHNDGPNPDEPFCFDPQTNDRFRRLIGQVEGAGGIARGGAGLGIEPAFHTLEKGGLPLGHAPSGVTTRD